MARAKKTESGEKKAAKPRVARKRAEKKASAGTGSVIDLAKYKDRYQVHDQKTASGRKSIDVGDRLAKAMRGLSAKEVIDAVEKNGGKVNPSWKDRNPGLARMAAGNVLRGMVRQGKSIEVGGAKIATL